MKIDKGVEVCLKYRRIYQSLDQIFKIQSIFQNKSGYVTKGVLSPKAVNKTQTAVMTALVNAQIIFIAYCPLFIKLRHGLRSERCLKGNLIAILPRDNGLQVLQKLDSRK